MSDPMQLLRQVRLALQTEDYPAAIDGLRQAVGLAQAANDHATAGRHLGNLGLLYYRLGETERALDAFERALASARADDDRMTENGLLGNMGNILRELGRYPEATDYLSRALLIAQEIGDVRGRGIWLSNLGLVCDDMGQFERARDLHGQAVAVARDLNDQRGLAARLSHLGESCRAAGDVHGALHHLHEACARYRELGDWAALTARLGTLSAIYTELGQRAAAQQRTTYLRLALDHTQQALALAEHLPDPHPTADLLRQGGLIWLALGERQQALTYLSVAAQHFAALERADDLAATRELLASLPTDPSAES